MRRSLLPSLGAALTANLRERERATLFEIGRVYLPLSEPGANGRWLPDEPRRLAVALAGPREPERWSAAHREPFDFYDLKGIVELLVARLGLTAQVSYAPLTDDERFHPGRAAALLLETGADALPPANPNGAGPKKGKVAAISRQVGVFGELHPLVRERLESGAPRAVMAEIDLDALFSVARQASYSAISRYPATVQDLSIVAPLDVPQARVAALIRRGAGDLLEDLALFDEYVGPQVGEGNRSLTYHLTFRAADRTLNEETLTKVRKKIIGGLEREIGATIRA
jgi:phenylalanyl-tRNA synthetase beta chain